MHSIKYFQLQAVSKSLISPKLREWQLEIFSQSNREKMNYYQAMQIELSTVNTNFILGLKFERGKLPVTKQIMEKKKSVYTLRKVTLS